MPGVDRNNPVRAKASDSRYSFMEFQRTYPDDAACLEFLWRAKHAPDGHTTYCAKCQVMRRFHRVKSRPLYSCDHCGNGIHPTKGTIFEKSSTSLHLWFYAMYLMTSTRCGISAKQLERELGVTYKTAWRMFNKIRNQLMADDGEPLTGEVEVDETSVEGRPRKRHKTRTESALYRERSRVAVVGAVERGGRIKTTVLPSRRGPALKETVVSWVKPEAIIYTDEWPAYSGLDRHFAAHSRIHHGSRQYVVGSTHTNTIEGFFGNLKTGIRGNYKKVSHRWLQGYLNEFTWRYNHRHSPRAQFETLLLRAASGEA